MGRSRRNNVQPKNRNRASHGDKKTLRVHFRYTIICPYCLQEFYSPDDMCIDHEFPRSRFVDTDTVLCCKKCNHEKGALTPAEYELWKSLRDANDFGPVWVSLEKLRNGHNR